MICELFPDKGGKWRWRCRARNARNTATSGESFASKSNAKRALRAFERAMMTQCIYIGVDLCASGKGRGK